MHKKIGGTYTTFKIWSLLWIYWQILNVFLAVLTIKQISVSQNHNPPIAFLRFFFCSHHHRATLKLNINRIKFPILSHFSSPLLFFFSTNQSLFDVRIPHEMRQYFSKTHQSWHKSSSNWGTRKYPLKFWQKVSCWWRKWHECIDSSIK